MFSLLWPILYREKKKGNWWLEGERGEQQKERKGETWNCMVERAEE
jgi:hypothetical protein